MIAFVFDDRVLPNPRSPGPRPPRGVAEFFPKDTTPIELSAANLGDCSIVLLFVAGSGNAQEDEHSTIQPHHVLVNKAADTCADL